MPVRTLVGRYVEAATGRRIRFMWLCDGQPLSLLTIYVRSKWIQGHFESDGWIDLSWRWLKKNWRPH